MNNFGPTEKRLNWEVEQPATQVDFLDLTVTIQEDGTIATKTFQKMMNLYLYQTPESCQPESIIRSFVYGALHKYYWQNTFECDFITFIELLFIRMTYRGHQRCLLLPIFQKSIKKCHHIKATKPNIRTTSHHRQ
jgi:hypothetical protein